MYTPNHEPLLETVSSIITGAIPSIAIYCFGMRGTFTHRSAFLHKSNRNEALLHFDLLLLTKENKPNLCNDVTALIKSKTAGVCSATILLHHPKSLQPKNPNRQHFFWQVLNRADLIYKNPEIKVYTVLAEPKRDYIASSQFWNTRYFLAKALIDFTPATTTPETQLIKVSMLHQAVSLMCIGLLEIFLGYRPNNFAIDFLFQLCAHFTTLPAEIFPDSSLEGRQFRHLLKLNAASLSHRNSGSINGDLLPEFEARCRRFLTEANILAEIYLMPHLNL